MKRAARWRNFSRFHRTGGDGSEDDPLAGLKADIRTARGKALLVETAAAGWGEGRNATGRRRGSGRCRPMAWSRRRTPRSTASCPRAGCRRRCSWIRTARANVRRCGAGHQNTVAPLARLVEAELTEKLEAEVKLTFDTYALDMVSRAQVVAKLTAAGVALPVALAAVGLGDEA